MAQQLEASTLGMWVFLVTEIMFFGGLFIGLPGVPVGRPEAFQEASTHLNKAWGAVNTIVLIVSSLTMAHGGASAQTSAHAEDAGGLAARDDDSSARRFLASRSIEYTDKFKHHLVPGPHFAVDRHSIRRAPKCSTRSTSA